MPNLKEQLRGKLTAKERSLIRKSFDMIGDIAIVEIPRELSKKKTIIGKAVMQVNPSIKAVYMEKSARSGKLRLQKLQWLAGEKRTETEAKENGIRLLLDVENVYYSPRMATDRRRVYEQVKKNERVLVMFSGCGPFSIEIAKHSKAKEVIGVELNKIGHKYAEKNVLLNKLSNVKNYQGDARKVVPTLKGKFDRILMPLPKGAYEYLDVALKKSKSRTVIHYYDFLPEEDIPKIAVDRIKEAAKLQKKNVRILRSGTCGQLGVRQYRVYVDFKVL